jgi:hypothetical protein
MMKLWRLGYPRQIGKFLEAYTHGLVLGTLQLRFSEVLRLVVSRSKD